MTHERWTASEKKIARRTFDRAVESELAEIMAEFKARAASATVPADMWDLRDHLTQVQQRFDLKYDYRYSVLETAFGILLAEGRIDEADLAGLAQDKLDCIRTFAEFMRQRNPRPAHGPVQQGRW